MTIWSDLPNEFLTNQITNDLSLKEDDLAVRQSVRNLMNLAFSEKPFHPEIGLNLKGMLFENLTPFLVAQTRRNLMEMLPIHEPRIRVVDVLFGEFSDDGSLVITLIYRIVNQQENKKIDFFFDRIR